MEPQIHSNSDPKSASLILKQLKEAAKAAEDVDDYYDSDEDEEDDDDDEGEEEEEERIAGRFGFRVESNNDGKVAKKKKLVATGGSGKGGATTGGGGVAPSCCQVEKCGTDLTEAKRYYKRHKVCEAHAKSPLVVVDGIRQRFCQQCSRFHELSEFDEMRRSCRSRLAGHNQRRRKLSSEAHREDSSSSSSSTSRSQLKEIQRGQVDERGRITIAVPGKHIPIR